MKYNFYCLMIVATTLGLLSCGGEEEKGITIASVEDNKTPDVINDPILFEIRDMEARSKKDSVIDRIVGLRLLRAYQEYYNRHPGDSLGLAFLFEAGRVADAMGKYEKAIQLLANYHDGISNTEKKAEAAYLVAFIYDAHLHNEKSAIKQYNKVIELYPNTIWAQQAKSALNLVGKSDEELLEFLKEKNQQGS